MSIHLDPSVGGRGPNGGGYTAYPASDEQTDGLTKRELFAAMAMQGLLADARTAEAALAVESAGGLSVGGVITGISVEYADALLLELSKSPAPTQNDPEA